MNVSINFYVLEQVLGMNTNEYHSGIVTNRIQRRVL